MNLFYARVKTITLDFLNEEINKKQIEKYNKMNNKMNNNKSLNDFKAIKGLNSYINSAMDNVKAKQIQLNKDANASVLHYFDTCKEYKTEFSMIKNGEIFATTPLGTPQMRHVIYFIANHTIGIGSTSVIIN